MHLYRPTAPAWATITRNVPCTAGRKSAAFVRHIEFDVSGTALAGACLPGQSIGVIPEGVDPAGKPHKLRLYSLASPTAGEDGRGTILSTTVKRTIDEHWETHRLFLGVCSNYLCDLAPGDRIRVTGPNGKRFVLPQNFNDHDYLFFATGTGIAPFRGMVTDLLTAGCTSRIALVMGSPYATDLLYHDQFTRLAAEHPNFQYLTALSRERNEPHGPLYVQDRLRTDADRLRPILTGGRGLIYICGLAGMELGILQQLARLLPPSDLEQFLHADAQTLRAVDAWQRAMLHKEVRPTRRVFLEVYA
jgi:ferredoxin--NADP+ reductase